MQHINRCVSGAWVCAICCWRRAFAHAVLCGVRLPSGEAVMNPAEGDVPPAGSQLIFLGRGGERAAQWRASRAACFCADCWVDADGHTLVACST